MNLIDILTNRLLAIARTVVEMTPELVVAVLLVLLTWTVAKLLVGLCGRLMRRSRMRPTLIDVLEKLLKTFIWLTGLLVAATVVFPDLTPGSLLAGLGLGSIAIGLAFKDTFENFLAGILILLRDPMRLGDHIECEGVEGRVEKITIRDTYIRQTDGQLVLVPNGLLFKNPLYVVTDRPKRRVTIICGVAYGEDVDRAREVIRAAVEPLDSVADGLPVQIFAQAFGDSSIDFEVTWWTGSAPVDVRRSRDQVVAAVKRALNEAGIEIPFPYRTLTFKDPVAIRNADATPLSDEASIRRDAPDCAADPAPPLR